MWKKLLVVAILAQGSVTVQAASSGADNYPTRPIRLVLGFPPGGADDFLARIVAPKMSERLGQSVVVDNRSGAAGNVGAEAASQATPDGYTLYLGPTTLLAASRSLYPKLGYDLLKDFEFISVIATGGTVLLAHPSLPAKSVSELVALARSAPKSIAYGSAGVASLSHLAAELLQSRTGIEFLHISYKGSAPNATALTAGEVKIGFASLAAALPMIQAKRLNALAVTTAKRAQAMPDVPTIAESGVPGYDVTISYGLAAPHGTPAPVIKVLNTAIRDIVAMPDVKARFATQAMEPMPTTPEQYRSITEADIRQWAQVIKDARIPANY